MLKLTNVQMSNDARVISRCSDYDSSLNRGIRTHNKFGKFFADLFGSGTIAVVINDKKCYLNKGSCYRLLGDNMLAAPKDKKVVIDQVQFIFNQIHTDFKAQCDVPINEAIEWVNKNARKLSSNGSFDEATLGLQFFQFINTTEGFDRVIEGYVENDLYTFVPKGYTYGAVTFFHYKESKEDSVKALTSLLTQLVASLKCLKTDEQKTQFFGKFLGGCIEASTSEPFLYAASLQSSGAELEPFHKVMGRYEDEAREALKGTPLTPDLLAKHISQKHNGEQCIGEACCPEGVITYDTALIFLLYTNPDAADKDSVID